MRRALVLLGLLAALPATATAEPPPETVRFVVKVQGMDCAGCNTKVVKALTDLSFIHTVHASFAAQAACAEGAGAVDEDAVTAAIAGLGYTYGGLEWVDDCPKGLDGVLPGPWEGKTAGLDVTTISKGEEVDVRAHLAAEKYTIIDYGAPWCGPCHEAADALVTYLGAHPDVAVRVVDLAGQTAEASYAQPVVSQHLKYVSGIPWLVVHAPGGKVLGKGPSVEKLLAIVDAHRAKAAK